MRIPIILFVFFTINFYSQEAFIQKNDGSKIVIDESSVRVIANDKLLLFKYSNSNSEKTLSFDEIDFANYSNFKFKSLSLNNRKEKDGYFILAEANNKLFICKNLSQVDPDTESVTTLFQLLVIDKQSTTIESLTINDDSNSKSVIIRNQILEIAKKHFANCDDFINRCVDYDKKNGDSKNLSILGVLNSPVYYFCN